MAASHETISDEIKEQTKKFKDLTLRQKLGYFWDYYKIPTLIVVLALIFLTSFLSDFRESRKETMLYTVLMGANSVNDYTSLEEDFASYAGIDLSNAHVTFDASLQPGSFNYQTAMAATQKMMAMTAAGNLDVIVASQADFDTYADAGYYQDLRTVLSKGQLSLYEDSFYYYTYDPKAARKEAEENGMTYEESQGPYDTLEPVPIGIKLDDLSMLPADTYPATGTYVFGFCANSTHPDYGIRFLEYLTGSH